MARSFSLSASVFKVDFVTTRRIMGTGLICLKRLLRVTVSVLTNRAPRHGGEQCRSLRGWPIARRVRVRGRSWENRIQLCRMAKESKTYPGPWHGQPILACRKCQKKLKGEADLRAMAKLKKTMKRHNKEHPDRALHVVNVPCMDLCPKDG